MGKRGRGSRAAAVVTAALAFLLGGCSAFLPGFDGDFPSSSRLDGGACHIQVSGVGHNEMDNDPAIFAHVLAAVDGTCTGTFR